MVGCFGGPSHWGNMMDAQQLQALLQLAGDFIFVVDEQGVVRFLHNNRKTASWPDPQAGIGKRQKDVFPAEISGQQWQEIQRVRETGEIAGGRWELGGGEGVQYLLAPVVDEEGRRTSVLGIGWQTGERGRTERPDLENQKRYQDLFDRAVEGILRTTTTGDLITANPALAKMLGYDSAEEMFLRVANAAQHLWVERAERARFVRMLEQDGTVRGFECQFRRKDGSAIWVSIQCWLVKGDRPDGAYFEGFLQDSTERKRAEGALMESEAKYRALFESSSDAALLTAPDGRVFTANAEACRMFGRTEEEICLLGRDGLIDVSDGRLAGLLEQRRLNGRMRGELTFVRADGTHFPGEISSSVFTDQEGNLRTSVTVRDVTERKRAEAEKAKLEAELVQAQKMESVGRLAGGVAHDFNNLLTVINGYSGLVLQKLDPQDPWWQYLTEIHKAGERATELAKQLLALSRKQIVKPVSVDVNRLMLDSRSLLERLIGDDVDIALDFEPGVGSVLADPGQLHQVLMNLVVNARDAMPDGGRLTLKTYVTMLPEDTRAGTAGGPYVVLSISDTGVGISEEVRRHLFEPFFTTKAQGKGTGLGLSIVYAIVKQSGGRIEVESQPGKGTTFRVSLPRLGRSAVELSGGNERAPQAEQANAALRGTETVLVVEDQDEVRHLAAAVLKAYGYRVLQAREGGEALEMLERDPAHVDLMLTDVMMPKMNGKELGEQLRQRWPHMAVILMSGYQGHAIDEDAQWHFLAKPFAPEALVASVRKALGPSRVRRRALVVDDDEAIRNLFATTLRQAGYDAALASDGARALEMLASGEFDVMITDLVMPGKEGIETIQAARKEWPNLKIVAVSGAFGGLALAGAALLGADATLAKPVRRDALVATVKSLLGG